jgi:hypothetical protein
MHSHARIAAVATFNVRYVSARDRLRSAGGCASANDGE